MLQRKEIKSISKLNVTFYVSEEIVEMIESLSEELNYTKSELISELVREEYKQHK